MTEYSGTIATAVAATGLANMQTAGWIDGRVKCMAETYTIVGTEAAASTIVVGGTIPAGAKVLAIILSVSAAQTSLTVSIGDDASATRYASAATSLQTAGAYIFGGKNYVIGTASGDNQIVLLTGGATATAGTLYAVVLFTTD